MDRTAGLEDADMQLIRPNGMIERLQPYRRHATTLESYGRMQPGPVSRDALRAASEQDRRRQRRRKQDPWRGHLVDLTA